LHATNGFVAWLEQAVSEASLVMVARVAEVREIKLTLGGKVEQSLQQFKFEPLQVLKGVFSREALLLNSDDLGGYQFGNATRQIKTGQVRMLILGRSREGYALERTNATLDQALPLLQDENDPLINGAKVLLRVEESRDRARKVTLLLDGLQSMNGPVAVPLLASLQRRSLLAELLDPHGPQLRWQAVEALEKIDTDGAAQALQPHLLEEANLLRKLELAEFLGRHGFRDGYPFAMEHLSEPSLREQAVSALAAIREPRAPEELRRILQTSHDLAWNSAAVLALGRLGDKERVAQFLEMVQDLKNPMAPAALVARGDLKEVKVLDKLQEGLDSRNAEVVAASARAAGQLLALSEVKAEGVHSHLAVLLTDGDASLEARTQAFKALVALNDPLLEGALAAAVRDGHLEGSDLMNQIEKQVRDQKVRL
jgi:HEAT repeat protein